MLCIKNGLVHDAVTEEPQIADILIENGKITAIGSFPGPAGDAQVIDASGLSVYPGFVEAHCHLGVDGYGIGFEGDDVNERGGCCSGPSARPGRHQSHGPHLQAGS